MGRDPQRLTFEDVDSKKPQLVNAASFVRVLDPSAKEITKKAVLRSLQGDARAARSARATEPAHHHHVGRERRGRASSSCSDALRRRGAVGLLNGTLVASALSGFDVRLTDTSGLISFSSLV